MKARGRIPTWCSAACRQRAWEQKRAAASGRSAIEVVERRVAVAVPTSPRHGEWVTHLRELERQLDTGAIYERDLRPLGAALNLVILTLNGKPTLADDDPPGNGVGAA